MLYEWIKVFIDLILSTTDELLILVNTMPMKRKDPGMSVYLVVHQLKTHNAVNVVLKLENHYFR